MRRFRELHRTSERYQAAIEAGVWGYPREMEESDLAKTAVWYRLGDTCIFWVEFLIDGSMMFHVCSHPDTAKRHPADAKRLHHALEFIADMHGCNRLLASDCGEGDEVASYLRRWGFTVCQDGDVDTWYERRLADGETIQAEDRSTQYRGRRSEKEEGAGPGAANQPEE